MEVAIPMLFSFWMCVAYITYGVIMIAIWICIGIMGGPCVRFNPPKIPPVPELPDIEKAEWRKDGK